MLLLFSLFLKEATNLLILACLKLLSQIHGHIFSFLFSKSRTSHFHWFCLIHCPDIHRNKTSWLSISDLISKFWEWSVLIHSTLSIEGWSFIKLHRLFMHFLQNIFINISNFIFDCLILIQNICELNIDHAQFLHSVKLVN